MYKLQGRNADGKAQTDDLEGMGRKFDSECNVIATERARTKQILRPLRRAQNDGLRARGKGNCAGKGKADSSAFRPQNDGLRQERKEKEKADSSSGTAASE
jgi:hypothetical protein